MLRYIPSILRRSISEITRATPAPTSHPTPRGLTRVTQPGQALYAPEHIGGGRGAGRGACCQADGKLMLGLGNVFTTQ